MCPPDETENAGKVLKWPEDFILLAARASGGGAPSVTFDRVLRKLAELVVMIDAVRIQGGFAPAEPPGDGSGKG